jgi:cysteinyl-tRNA synthetase
MTDLYLYNTLSRKKDLFTPLDEKNVRMYVCGPTVYDRPHIGNARSAVVYDVLYRLLCHLYGNDHVTFVRNITDVDDKINAAAKANGEAISTLTERVTGWFHDDMEKLGCLRPNVEPRATAHIAQMIGIIEQLIAGGHAYVSQRHALFRVASFAEYGALSGRKLEDLIAGARIEVESYKEHPGDFVLWKPAEEGDDPSSVFDSPWGAGRPGWHIECSAMSQTYLGAHFDIHGGGADLMFPHHENEIAQSRCADPAHNHFANYWVHNGFLTVNGEKMSKSLGNFITVKELLDKGVAGEVIRFAFLSTHYRSPLDWTDKLLDDSKKSLDYLYNALGDYDAKSDPDYSDDVYKKRLGSEEYLNGLLDDFNTAGFISVILKEANTSNSIPEATRLPYKRCLYSLGRLLGLFNIPPEQWFKGDGDDGDIQTKINARIEAKKAKNWAEADRIRKELAEAGIILEDRPDGTTDWRKA